MICIFIKNKNIEYLKCARVYIYSICERGFTNVLRAYVSRVRRTILQKVPLFQFT